MFNLRKIFTVFVMFAFVLQSSFAFARNSRVRSAASTTKTSSTARSSTTTARSSSTARASTSASARASVSTTNTNTNINTNTSSTNAYANMNKCRAAYMECMDIQAKGFAEQYAYIRDDKAAITMQEEEMDALRCIYYDSTRDPCNSNGEDRPSYCNTESQVELVAGQIGAENEEFTPIKPTNNFNDLYFAYNYYCTPLQGWDENNYPKTYCYYNRNLNDTFASKNSMAFYQEAFDRVEKDELVIINFNQSSLYQDSLKKYGVTGEFAINTSDVSDMFTALGLSPTSSTFTDSDGNEKTSYDLFSISVAPPYGAGTINARSLWEKADKICRKVSSLPTTANSKLTSAQTTELNRQRNLLGDSSCENLMGDMETFYLYGYEMGCDTIDGYTAVYDAGEGTCTDARPNPSTVEGEDEDEDLEPLYLASGFGSAKASCNTYEMALMTVRNQIYAKFTDQMANHLDQELAKLLAKEAQKTSTISEAIVMLLEAEGDARELVNAETQRIQGQILDQKNSILNNASAVSKMKELCTSNVHTTLETIFASDDVSAAVANLNLTTVYSDTTGNTSLTKPSNALEPPSVGATHEFYCVEDLGIDISSIINTVLNSMTFKNCTTYTSTSATLPAGMYQVRLYGAGGGGGGNATNGYPSIGGSGGRGGYQVRTFVTLSPMSYTVSKGKGGNGASGTTNDTGKAGSAGTGTSFNSVAVSFTAAGGKGGGSAPPKTGTSCTSSDSKTLGTQGSAGSGGSNTAGNCTTSSANQWVDWSTGDDAYNTADARNGAPGGCGGGCPSSGNSLKKGASGKDGFFYICTP